MNIKERKLCEMYFKKMVIERIREARIARGWTQAELAEAIDVSHEFIRSIESFSGKKTISLYTVWRIAKALNISLDTLLNFDLKLFDHIIEKQC